MKPGAYLINVGRGSVVDTNAMIENLESGHLGAAGIDVVDPEPLPAQSPLWDMDHVLITPHVGAQSPRRIPVTVDLFCNNLSRFRAGQSLLNLVDKDLGFPRPENRISFTD
jgi:phosphoglycerate dehydrogenase-like enzyme